MIQDKIKADSSSEPSWKPTKPMFFGLALLSVAFLIWAIASTVSAGQAKQALRDEQSAAQSALASSKSDYENRLQEAAQAGLKQTALGVSAALSPLIALQGQVPEITDRSLQSAVTNLVQNKDLRFVAISDSSGNVVAASDLTLIGRPIKAPSDMQVATASIGDDQANGAVWLGIK